MPEDTAESSAIEENNITEWCRDECGFHLEYEDPIGVTLSVECESACYLESAGGGIVNTRNQSMPTKLSTNGSNRCSSSGIVICGYQILLGLNCDSISHVYRPMQCYAIL